MNGTSGESTSSATSTSPPMAGAAASSGPAAATTTTGLGSSAYSFYLNIVVLNHQPGSGETSSHSLDESSSSVGGGGGKDGEEAAAAAKETNLAPAAAREEEEESAAPIQKKEEDAAPSPTAQKKGGDSDAAAGGADAAEGADDAAAEGAGSVKGLFDSLTKPKGMGGMAGMGSGLGTSLGLTKSMQSMHVTEKFRGLGAGLGSNLDKSLHNTMKAVSKRSVSLSDKAAAYVANKTMIARASSALDRAIPAVAAAVSNSGAGGGTKLDLTIGRRFQQGPVIVLQVDLRASGLSAYIEAVRGEDAAEHYRCAMSSLKLLGAAETVKELEREMLPVIRRGLMERTAEEVVRGVKEKDDSGAPLEVECIALEEKEEARWLFTYMEFQSQMK